MRTRGLVFVSVVALVVFASSWTETRSAEGDMRVQFGVLYSMPTGDLKDMGQTTSLENTLGWQVSFEYAVTDLIGVEPAITSVDSDVEVEESGFPDLKLGTIETYTLSVNVNFHVLRGDTVDLFVGPTVGYAFRGDLKSPVFMESYATDDEFVYGLNVGVDVPFGDSSWSFTGGLDYQVSEINLQGDSQSIGVDPVELKLGVSYTF